MRVDVSQGEIPVNSVSILQQNADAVLLLIDSSAKRYCAVTGGDGDGTFVVYLSADDDTLHAATDAAHHNLSTEVRITGLGRGRWYVTAEAAKYETLVAMIRQSEDGGERVAWPAQRALDGVGK